jgi:putative oxidoreductase
MSVITNLNLRNEAGCHKPVAVNASQRIFKMIDYRTASFAAFLLRVSLGVMLLAHGLLKVLVFTPAGTVAFFESVGYPGALAYLVIAGELAGGAALVLGFMTRAAALASVPILIGATVQHVPNGWMFANANGGWEYPAFWTVALVVQALLGPGAWAVSSHVAAGSRTALA